VRCDDLDGLESILARRADEVRAFLDVHDARVQCPFTASVDIRRNAHKAAVVDANAYPAGFNNLPRASRAEAAAVARGYLARHYSDARHLLLLGESHTRNAPYFHHLAVLRGILHGAGYSCTLATLSPEVEDRLEASTPEGPVTVHRARRDGDRLAAGDARADVVILNNDLSEGVPPELEGVAQPVNPPPAMGWHRRRKSDHFAIVRRLADGLGSRLGFDPWLITAEAEPVAGVDFRAGTGMDRVAAAIDRVIARTQERYDLHGIRRTPSAFVKPDAGTYGMGVTTAASGEAFLASLNSRERGQLDRAKGRTKVTQVLVQEAVPSDVRGSAGFVAEAVLYMVCSRPVGAFHRTHGGKGDAESLNAPGSSFEPLAFPGQPRSEGEGVLDPCSAQVYRVLGKLASIATGYEMAQAAGRPLLPA
jgi:glutamate--cysteine ligase